MKHITACIDFGTSNSAASIVDENNNIIPVGLEGKNLLLPSAMFFYYNHDDPSDEKNGKIFFGHQAEIENMENHENGRFIRSFKSLLANPDTILTDSTTIYDKRVTFANILALFLGRIKFMVDITAKQDVKHVILGRPVHFVDNDEQKDQEARDILQQIAKSVGFEDVKFQFEPVAASFYHKQNINPRRSTYALVVDIGGGTSDFSVVDLYNTRFKPTTTGIHIGGNDFDEKLASDHFMPLYGKDGKYYADYDAKILKPLPSTHYDNLSKWIKINDVHFLPQHNYNVLMDQLKRSCEPNKTKYLKEIIDNKLGFVNLAKVEETKKKLSDKKSVDVNIDFLSDNPTIKITRNQFVNTIDNKVQQMKNCIQECLYKSGKSSDDIDYVIFTGGSSQIPHIQDTVLKIVPRAKLVTNNCMTSVCEGLAYYAQSLNQ
ncbi:MAG: Hsp70 family protein [Alphaproteobacteria bacterium]|nr:Hsp70 family protein [Alphaproteobacteria bacterium]